MFPLESGCNPSLRTIRPPCDSLLPMAIIPNPQQVVEFLRTKANLYFCDDCVCKELDVKISRRQQVKQITSTLGLCVEFDRRSGQCAACNYQKMVFKSFA